MATKKTTYLREKLAQREETREFGKAVGIVLLGTGGVAILMLLLGTFREENEIQLEPEEE